MIPHFTVVGYDDWYGLFNGEELVDQGHSIEMGDLIRASKGEPFTLSKVVHESIGDYLLEQGQFYSNETLSFVLALTK